MTALRNQEVDMILDVSAKEARMLESVSSVEVVSVPGTFSDIRPQHQAFRLG